MDNNFNKVFKAHVKDIKIAAQGVKVITLGLASQFTYKPWQYVWVEIPNMKIQDQHGNRRAFSILNTINDKNTIDIVARISESGYKQSLFALSIGDEVIVHGPFGNSFIISEQHKPQNIIMIAGGVGIAAFLPMIKTIELKKYPIKSRLIYANNSPDVTPFLSELTEIQKNSQFFSFVATYEHFKWSDVAEYANKLQGDTEWWITGPKGMVNQTFMELERGGVSRANMYFEQFYPSSKNELTLEVLKLQMSENNYFAKAIQNSTNHTVITDSQGYVLFANNAAVKTTGYSQEEIIGNTPRLWGGLMSQKFYEDFWRKKNSGESFQGEIINRRKNGEIYYASAHIAPIFDKNKNLIGYIGTEEDITEMKKKNKEIEENEFRLRAALEGNRDGIWDWNLQTNEVFFSKRWKEMLGYSDDEIKGSVEEWERRVHPDDLKQVEKILNDHLEGKTPFYQSEHRVLCKDGSYKWILDRGKVTHRDAEGKPLRASGTHTDISEQKKLQKLLEEKTLLMQKEKERDDIILSSIAEGLTVVDSSGNTILANKAAEQILGWTKQELVGKNFIDLIPMYDKEGKLVPREQRALTRALKGEIVRIFGNQYVRKNKAHLPVDLTVSPFVVDNIIYGCVEVFKDIRREMEIDRAKTEFISLASHQLRTPLTTINWYLEMLIAGDSGTVNESQKKFLEEAYKGGQRLVKLVNALLNVSRLESGTYMVEPVPLDVVKLIHTVLDEERPMINEKKQHISLKNQTIPLIPLDPNLMTIIFQNLLTNAIKYTSAGGSIDITISLSGNNLLIAVQDSGIGIPENEKDKIFTKLYRAENVKKTDAEGTGLGLYMVSQLIEKAKGKIWYESIENKGSTFFVSLPLIGMEEKSGTRKIEVVDK